MTVITGTNNNDILVGSSDDEKIEGLGGNDFLVGLGGNDDLQGGDDIDALFGGEGDDFLEGNKGDDFMFGGEGNDTLEWDNGDGTDLMIGGAGYDRINVNGSADKGDEFTLQQQGTQAIFDRLNLVPFKLTVESSEVFKVDGKGSDDSFIVGDLSDTAVRKVKFFGGLGNDTLDASGSSTVIKARGGDGDDSLTGGTAADTLRGGKGNDSIQGGKGSDRMIGGAGDDLLVWAHGEGSDRISGGAGQDIVGVQGSLLEGDVFTLNRLCCVNQKTVRSLLLWSFSKLQPDNYRAFLAESFC
ncbi:MAG: calcium-binding protein, partial [Phormidesmis sp.]